MKNYRYLSFFIILISLMLIAGVNIVLKSTSDKKDQWNYIEMNRISSQVQSGKKLSDLKVQSPYIKSVEYIPLDNFTKNRLENTEAISYWTLYNNAGELSGFLKFERNIKDTSAKNILLINCFLFAMLAITAFVLWYIAARIIKPFTTIENLPCQLAKGSLNTQLKEFPEKYFGKFIWGLNMLRDTLNNSRQKTLYLEKERHTMLASISHGVKTPVSNIRLYASAIGEGMYTGDKLMSAVKSIDDNAEKINQLINELINTTSSSFSDIEIDEKDFYLKDWLDDIKNSYSEELSLKHIKFEVSTNVNLLLHSDPNALSAIVNNLLDNAVKYGDGGYIEISAEKDDYNVIIHVTNSGTPPAPHELPHIFTSYWRGSNAANAQGSGLGLFICKNLARKLGGEIYASAKDNEMVFTIILDYDQPRLHGRAV